MDIQVKNFTGGMNQDALMDAQRDDEYFTALDIQHELASTGTTGSITMDDGNVLAFSIPGIAAQSQLYVLTFEYTTSAILFDGYSERTGASLFSGSAQDATANGAAWGLAIRADINAAITASGGNCAVGTQSGTTWYFVITFSTQSVNWVFDDVANLSTIIQEGYFGAYETGALIPFSGIQHLNQLLIFSSKDNDAGQSYYNGVGEIGVATQHVTTGVFTYVRLARSKKFKFSTTYTMDARVEGISTGRNGIYFTDNVLVPRVFYYNYSNGAYINDWSITRYSPTYITSDNPNGYYSYNNIDSAIALQLQPNTAVITDPPVVSAGGILTSGGKKYSCRFMVDTNLSTRWSSLSNLVEIPSVLYPAYNSQGGDGSPTTYKVSFTIDGCDPTLYDYVEVACVEYNEGAVSGIIIGRYPLTNTSIDIVHTGSESGQTNLDLAEMADIGVVIATAKNIEIQQNRLWLANLTLEEDEDLSAWAQAQTPGEATLTRTSLANTNITAVNFTAFAPAADQEYYLPNNTHDVVGYMPNEQYRFGIRIYFKNGSVSRVYFMCDYRFDSASPFPSNATPSEINIRYFDPTIDFSAPTFPLDFNTVEGYEIVRAECIPEVLACGLALGSYGNPEAGYYAAGYPLASLVAQPPNSSTLSGFFSPDLYLGYTQITPTNGDQIYNYGTPAIWNTQTINPAGNDYVSVSQFSGVVDTTPQIVTVNTGEAVPFNSRGLKVLSGGLKYTTKRYTAAGTFGGTSVMSLGLDTSAALAERTAATNYLIYFCFYIRSITDKYGDYRNTQYISCGHYRQTNSAQTTYATNTILGGDTFSQKHWLRSVYASLEAVNVFFCGTSYYCYSRANGQMRRQNNTSSQITFPLNTSNLQSWLYIASDVSEDLAYNTGYSPSGAAQQFVPYNPDEESTSRQPTRVQYSVLRPTNSPYDAYRSFQPLDFKDFPLKDGEINGLFQRGNDLLVMQANAIYSQGINTSAVISTTDGLPVSLGSGDVMATQAQFLTSFGLSQKGAAHKYSSARGGTSIAWLDSISKNFMRIAGDGIRVISEENNMKSWFYNNLTRVRADLDMSICYDVHKEELLITAKGNYDGGSSSSYWWTLAFNERLNAFTTFRSAKPQTYFEFKDFVLSVNYTVSGTANGIYSHLWVSGAIPSVYGASIATGAFVRSFFNKRPLDTKRFLALYLNTTVAPTRISFIPYSSTSAAPTASTATTTTFVARRDFFVASITNQTADDGKVRSKFLGMELVLSATSTTRQRIISYLAKFNIKNRNPFS